MSRLMVVLFVCLCSSVGWAQRIGDRAVGLGGAFVALANDPSAIWYNPAGLQRVATTLLSASANAYAYKKLTLKDFVAFDERGALTAASFKADSVAVYPSTLAYATRLGSGPFRHGVGFAVFVADAEKANGGVVFSSSGKSVNMTFETLDNRQDYFAGPGYAFGVGKFAVGVSALFRLFDKEYSYKLFEDVQAGSQKKFISARIFTETYRHLSLVPSIGVQWEPWAGLKLGMVASPPSWALWGDTAATRVVTEAGTEVFVGTNPPQGDQGDPHEQTHLEGDAEAILKRPYRLALGIAYEKPESFAIEVAAELSGAIDPYMDRKPTLPNSTEAEHNLLQKELGVDIRAGVEVSLTPDYQLRAGLFTRFAHHPGFGFGEEHVFKKNNSAAGDRFENQIGANLALGLRSDHARTSYGISVAHGYGEAIGFLTRPPSPGNLPGPGEDLHEKGIRSVDSSSWQIVFVVSGVFEPGAKPDNAGQGS